MPLTIRTPQNPAARPRNGKSKRRLEPAPRRCMIQTHRVILPRQAALRFAAVLSASKDAAMTQAEAIKAKFMAFAAQLK
jgi:hypothetical protein